MGAALGAGLAMDSLERIALPLVRADGAGSRQGGGARGALPGPGLGPGTGPGPGPAVAASAGGQVMVSASLASAIGKKPVSGSFCLAGGTMEGIIQCLVFLKAFQVGMHYSVLSPQLIHRKKH